MKKGTSSPYGPSYQKIQEQKNNEKALKVEKNLLLKEIATELKSLSSAVAAIAKHME